MEELTRAQRSHEWAKYAVAFPTHQWHSYVNKVCVRLKTGDRHHPPKRMPWGLEMEWDDSKMMDAIRNWVSWEWEPVTCLCPNATYRNGDYTVCTTCGKMARHNLYICKGCKTKQCLRFTWPGQTLQDVTLCFFCLVKKFGMIEGAVPPKWQAREIGEFNADSLTTDLFDLDDLEF